MRWYLHWACLSLRSIGPISNSALLQGLRRPVPPTSCSSRHFEVLNPKGLKGPQRTLTFRNHTSLESKSQYLHLEQGWKKRENKDLVILDELPYVVQFSSLWDLFTCSHTQGHMAHDLMRTGMIWEVKILPLSAISFNHDHT